MNLNCAYIMGARFLWLLNPSAISRNTTWQGTMIGPGRMPNELERTSIVKGQSTLNQQRWASIRKKPMWVLYGFVWYCRFSANCAIVEAHEASFGVGHPMQTTQSNRPLSSIDQQQQHENFETTVPTVGSLTIHIIRKHSKINGTKHVKRNQLYAVWRGSAFINQSQVYSMHLNAIHGHLLTVFHRFPSYPASQTWYIHLMHPRGLGRPGVPALELKSPWLLAIGKLADPEASRK